MAAKPELAPTVRAYEYGNTIIVKYYDTTGAVNTLNCPLCHWIGALDVVSDARCKASPEFRCPDCNTRLARLSDGYDADGWSEPEPHSLNIW